MPTISCVCGGWSLMSYGGSFAEPFRQVGTLAVFGRAVRESRANYQRRSASRFQRRCSGARRSDEVALRYWHLADIG